MPQQFPSGPFSLQLDNSMFEDATPATLYFGSESISFAAGIPGQPLQITLPNLPLTRIADNQWQFSFQLQDSVGGYPNGDYQFTISPLSPASSTISGTATVPDQSFPVSWTADATLANGPLWVQISGITFPTSDAVAYLMFDDTGMSNFAVGEFGAVNDWLVLQYNIPVQASIDANVGLQWLIAFELDAGDADPGDGYNQGLYQFTFDNPASGIPLAGTVSMPDPDGSGDTVTGSWTATPLFAATQPFTVQIPSNDFDKTIPVTLIFPDNGHASLTVGTTGSTVVSQTNLPVIFDDNTAELLFQFELDSNGSAKSPQNGGWINGTYKFHFYLPSWTNSGEPDVTEIWGILDDPYHDASGDDEPWTGKGNPPTEDETGLSRGAGN